MAWQAESSSQSFWQDDRIMDNALSSDEDVRCQAMDTSTRTKRKPWSEKSEESMFER